MNGLKNLPHPHRFVCKGDQYVGFSREALQLGHATTVDRNGPTGRRVDGREFQVAIAPQREGWGPYTTSRGLHLWGPPREGVLLPRRCVSGAQREGKNTFLNGVTKKISISNPSGKKGTFVSNGNWILSLRCVQ